MDTKTHSKTIGKAPHVGMGPETTSSLPGMRMIFPFLSLRASQDVEKHLDVKDLAWDSHTAYDPAPVAMTFHAKSPPEPKVVA